MTQLKSFHLYTQFNKEPVNVESFLSTFQTQFWFDHHWTFGIHETYLYTIPFYFDNMKDFIDFDQIKSNNSVILNSSKTWSHVKSIDSSNSSKFSLNLIKQLKSKMPNLASLTFSFKLMRNLFTNDNETNQTDITLDSVTTVHCEIGDLKTIKRWLAEDILNYDPSIEPITLIVGSNIRIKWTDGKIYSCKYLGRKRVLLYHIKIDNETRQMRRSEFSYDIQPPSPPLTPGQSQREHNYSRRQPSTTNRKRQRQRKQQKKTKRKRRCVVLSSSSSSSDEF
ncbi:unnamed protein product [Rotaria sp. Silwood1]|nr:unnamed protein product [Rotaria sp. Silwood1]